MALSKIDAANFLTGTIPQGNVANASLGAVTALPGAIATGRVLQVVSVVADVETASTSSSYADITEMTASITPSSTSNKVFVSVQLANCSKFSGDTQLDLKLLRDSSAISLVGGLNDGSSTAQTSLGGIINFLDSPSSTSSLTYKVQLSNRDGNGTVTVQGNNKDGSITLMEIAGW